MDIYEIRRLALKEMQQPERSRTPLDGDGPKPDARKMRGSIHTRQTGEKQPRAAVHDPFSGSLADPLFRLAR